MDYEKLISERPEYFLFNGAVGALTKAHPLRHSPAKRCVCSLASVVQILHPLFM